MSKSSAHRNLAVAVALDDNHETVNLLGGYSIRETAGSTATVNLRKGVAASNNTGALLAVINLAANESVTVEFITPIPADPTYGVYYEDLSGTTAGTLFRRTQ